MALILLAATSVVSGDYFAKLWSTSLNDTHMILAFIGYFFSAFFFIPTLLREGLVTTSILWSVLSIIGFVIVGLLIFNETLSTIQIIGVVLGIISLLVLSI